MLNRCEFIGRLGADPEIRQTSDGKKIANLRIAVSESWKDKNTGEKREKTEWIPVTIFNEGLAGVAERFLKKGSQIYVSGTWQTRKWQDKDGNDRYSTECVLQSFDSKLVMLDNKSDGGGNNSSGGDRGNSTQSQAQSSRDLDDNIPF